MRTRKEWEIEAQNTIARLKEILGDVIKDIQHVGSTSILTIKAKPIIDIAVAVDQFDDILACEKNSKMQDSITDRSPIWAHNCCLHLAASMKAQEICRHILSMSF